MSFLRKAHPEIAVGGLVVQKILIGVVILLQFGCLEVKGPEESGDVQKQVAGEAAPDSPSVPSPEPVKVERTLFETNEPLYFWEGQFLKSQEWQSVKAKGLKPEKMDYEFQVDDMILGPQAQLYTNGFNIRFNIDKLVSSEGLLATFPAGQTASSGQVAKSGGHIRLEVKKSEGFLKIELRGEKGSIGKPSLANKNLNGLDAKIKMISNCINIHDPYHVPQWIVEKHAEEGQKGLTGGVGNPGGNSGSLDIHLPQDPELKYRVERIPGPGGDGGPGGPGGIGGILAGQHCSHKEKKRAASGPSGDPGQEGRPGENQPVCLIRQEQMTCY